jgi:hypothetical protein
MNRYSSIDESSINFEFTYDPLSYSILFKDLNN